MKALSSIKIESFGSAGFIASIDSIKGMVAQSDTAEGAKIELIISYMAYLASQKPKK